MSEENENPNSEYQVCTTCLDICEVVHYGVMDKVVCKNCDNKTMVSLVSFLKTMKRVIDLMMGARFDNLLEHSKRDLAIECQENLLGDFNFYKWLMNHIDTVEDYEVHDSEFFATYLTTLFEHASRGKYK